MTHYLLPITSYLLPNNQLPISPHKTPAPVLSSTDFLTDSSCGPESYGSINVRMRKESTPELVILIWSTYGDSLWQRMTCYTSLIMPGPLARRRIPRLDPRKSAASCLAAVSTKAELKHARNMTHRLLEPCGLQLTPYAFLLLVADP